MSSLSVAANVSATNAVSEIDQGRIGNVSALGALSGSLSAAYSIGALTSGDAITAALSAPNQGNVLPFDTGIQTSLLVPTVPASVRGDVLPEEKEEGTGPFKTTASTTGADVISV